MQLPLGCVNEMSHQPDMHIVGVMMSIVVCEEPSSSISRLLMYSWNSIVPLRSARPLVLTFGAAHSALTTLILQVRHLISLPMRPPSGLSNEAEESLIIRCAYLLDVVCEGLASIGLGASSGVASLPITLSVSTSVSSISEMVLRGT